MHSIIGVHTGVKVGGVKVGGNDGAGADGVAEFDAAELSEFTPYGVSSFTVNV